MDVLSDIKHAILAMDSQRPTTVELSVMSTLMNARDEIARLRAEVVTLRESKPIITAAPADDEFRVECCFCHASKPSVESAVDAGWIPSYFDDTDEETDEPVCSDCIEKHLEFDAHGVPMMKETR